MQREDDEAWQAIVDNYGEVPEISDEAAGPAGTPTTSGPAALGRDDSPYASPDDSPDDAPEEHGWGPGLPDLDEDRFVPPVPPPVPRPSRDRGLAWAGVFGSPAVLLICLVLGIALPHLLSYLLVAAFVGGFCYLVWQMPSGPRDPNDDGAVV